ncbi:TlyA family RNA methyltransferase [Glutamicibacter endophyticus]|uniref:TlyA family RNA methyltransferase n=1 Tax=Glutamicibacter endophyticus TaxID=1522174 RepID=UPI003AF0AAE5
MNRLDMELVARGLARSRTEAAKLIEAGLVQVDGHPSTKASKKIAAQIPISVAQDSSTQYVSRAGHKLAGALDHFGSLNPAGVRALDAGASTGGFTDVLLRRGAAHVVAVDVGHGQLVDEIRFDERVSVHEGLNVRYLDPADIGGEVDLVVADLSFISLRLVLEALAGATRAGGDLLLMVKPQFEVGREHVGKTGVVSSPELRRSAVEQVVQAALQVGLGLAGLGRSQLPGQDGNVEFFVWFQKSTAPGPQTGLMEQMFGSVDYS